MAVDEKKYENLILYLCRELGGKIKGKKKLAKLLYYVDFDRFEYKEYGKSITGDLYEAWKMGPVPMTYAKVIEKLESQDKLARWSEETGNGYAPTEVIECKSEPDMSVFTPEDVQIINRVIKRYGDLSGKQLEDLTHGEAPYIATDPSEEIIYDLAYYRGTDFSDVMATA